MKFGKFILQGAVPEWSSAYIDYAILKKHLKTCVQAQDTNAFFEITKQESEQAFTDAYLEQLDKAEQFYIEREQHVLNQLRQLEQQQRFLNSNSTKKQKMQLKKAVSEFYRHLQLIKNFKTINTIAVQKILKKYQKRTGNRTIHMMTTAEQKQLFQSIQIDTIIKETEQLYERLTGLPRKQALDKLRLNKMQSKASIRRSVWRSGFGFGACIPLIVIALSKIASQENNTFLLNIWAGICIPMVVLFLFSVCLDVWDYYRINYVLIMELDQRNHMTHFQYGAIVSGLSLYFSIAFYCYSFDTFGLNPSLYPTIYVGSLVILYFIPIRFYYKARLWLAATIVRILTSGFHKVQFRDFFITDILSSMTVSFVALESVACIAVWYPNETELCSLSNSWAASLVTALPALFRMIQCIVRYHADKKAHPHLTNMLKYVFTLTVISLSLSLKSNLFEDTRTAWIFFSVVSFIYSYLWDVLFDWGLCKQSKNWMLRDEIIYPPWIYYFAIVTNFIFRASWVLTLSPNHWNIFPYQPAFVFFIGILEAFRRCLWALLRMENEHSQNVGEYRAVKELPLPFKVVQGYMNDEDEE